MTDTNQKLREALQAYQDANEMSPYGDYSKIEWESSAGPVNPSWGGGDCKKHGRWYGRCYSCSDEWDNLRKRADRDAYTVRENALNAAKQMARQALALPTAPPLSHKPGCPADGGYGNWPEPCICGAAPVGEREAFEREMSKPPFEFCMDRWPDDGAYAWPGGYAAYHTQCAWGGWQGRAALRAGVAGERELFEQFAQNCPMGKYNVTRRGEGYDSSHTQIMWDAWQAGRAALSAGDAVDGPLIDEGSKPALSPLSAKDAIALIEEHTNDDNVLHAHEAIELIRSVERAHGIDAAMRKGQL